MTIIRAIITLFNNQKNIIITVIIVALVMLLGLQTYRIQHAKMDAEREKVAAYKKMVEAQKDYTARLTRLAQATSELQGKIDRIKLQQERCQNNEYYQTANDIIVYFNQ